MDIKLSKVLNIYYTLRHVIDDDKSSITPLTKFKLLGVMKELESPVINFETIKGEKIRELGTSNEEGVFFIDANDQESVKKFNESILPILDSEVLVDLQKIKAEDIFNKGLSAEQLVALYEIIEA